MKKIVTLVLALVLVSACAFAMADDALWSKTGNDLYTVEVATEGIAVEVPKVITESSQQIVAELAQDEKVVDYSLIVIEKKEEVAGPVEIQVGMAVPDNADPAAHVAVVKYVKNGSTVSYRLPIKKFVNGKVVFEIPEDILAEINGEQIVVSLERA